MKPSTAAANLPLAPGITGHTVSVYGGAEAIRLMTYLVERRVRFDADPCGDHYNLQILGPSPREVIREAFERLGWKEPPDAR
jgi:hypothetical protein